MPINDYRCPSCGLVEENVYVPLVHLPEPITVNGYRTSTRLPSRVCSAGCSDKMEIIPPRITHDLFAPFECEVLQPDGSHKTVRIDTLSQLRRLESESERAHRNGEGQQMVWRSYSQDRGNTYTHTIAADPTPSLSPEAKRKFGSSLRKSAEEPIAELGPGVDDSNVSALAGEP